MNFHEGRGLKYTCVECEHETTEPDSYICNGFNDQRCPKCGGECKEDFADPEDDLEDTAIMTIAANRIESLSRTN